MGYQSGNGMDSPSAGKDNNGEDIDYSSRTPTERAKK